jgi:hypothetical protein
MIERLLSVGSGALATWLALVFLNPTQPPGGDPNPDYITAVVIGAIVSLIWPLAWGFFAARRIKNRRDQQIADEVARQTGKPG